MSLLAGIPSTTFQRVLDIKESLMSVLAINYPNLGNLTSNVINTLEKCCRILKISKVTEEILKSYLVLKRKLLHPRLCCLAHHCKKVLNEH